MAQLRKCVENKKKLDILFVYVIKKKGKNKLQTLRDLRMQDECRMFIFCGLPVADY